MGREEALAEELRKTQDGNSSKYDYVNVRALERLGIGQYKTQQGSNFIRIIDLKFSKYPANNKPFYGKEVWLHMNVGADQRTVVCVRKMWGERCAVCELMDKLRAANPQDERVKELWPSHRFLFFVYDTRSTETEKKGLQWYDAPPTVKDGIISISKDKRTNQPRDVSSRINGADVSFDKIGSGKNGTKYIAFQLTDGPQPPESWYATAPDDFDEFILHPKYEDVLTMVAQLGPLPASAQTAPASSETRVRGESPSGVVQDPSPEVRQAVPIPVPSSTAQPVPAPQPAVSQATPPAAPAPEPQPAVATQQVPAPAPDATPSVQQVEVRVRGEATPSVVETRVRGEAGTSSSAIAPEVRNRIEQLRQGA